MAKNKAAVALGKKGGKAKSAAKALSSKANGAKGGRPKTKKLSPAVKYQQKDRSGVTTCTG